MEKKAMLGHKVRRLRREQNLTQAEMAEQLGISPSYLNLIEHNQRPVTVPLLLKLAQIHDIDLQSFAEDEEVQLLGGLREVFGDALFEGLDVPLHDMREVAGAAPVLADAVNTLYAAYREQREQLQALAERFADQRDGTQLFTGASFSMDHVRDYFHDKSNHFPELEAAAEELWAGAELDPEDLQRGLIAYLQKVHQVRVRVLPVDVMGSAIRRFDRHNRRILLSEMLPASGRTFQLATQIAILQHRDLLDRLVEEAALPSEEAARLLRVGLTNYFAGAVQMPYDRFLEAARAARYDIDVLMARFDASFEQVCHRMTTLQRPGAKGVPFFLIRTDKAGNVSKRFSATGFHFARFGGACPLWVMHDAFRVPGTIHTQLAAMPDGTVYFSLARTVTKTVGGYAVAPQHYALALGCEVSHAGQLIYADDVDLKNLDAAAPIGTSCRLCERLDCAQRAFPPINHRLIVDEYKRSRSPFYFTPTAAEGR